MVTQNNGSEATRIYSINLNFDFQEVEKMVSNAGDEVKYWITEYRALGLRWPSYRYECYDRSGGLVVEIKKNGWRMIELRSYGDQGYINFLGADPNGRIMRKGTGTRIQGVLKSISFLDEVSQFNSWEQYQLLKENEALQAKLELLTQEKNKLQVMLDNSE